jgi:hypothetical protein
MDFKKQEELAEELVDLISNAIKDGDLSIGEGNSIEDFMYVLSVVVPTYFHNRFTGEEKNILEYNHMVNQFIFEVRMEKEKESALGQVIKQKEKE